MDKWIKGNVPKDTGKYYWITRKGISNQTLPTPCKYSQADEAWITFTGERWSKHVIIAYCEISMPKPYETIGTGSGYYIRAVYRGQESIYGLRLEPANWVGCGYQTIEKAKAALKRLVKIDKENNYDREVYEVVDGVGKMVWSWNGK